MFVHVYALFIHVLTILRSNNEGHGFWYSSRRGRYVAMEQRTSGCSLQIIFGADLFLIPSRNLPDALDSRDAWTFPIIHG